MKVVASVILSLVLVVGLTSAYAQSEPPSVPRNLEAISELPIGGGTGLIQVITWDAPESNGSSDIVGYHIEFSYNDSINRVIWDSHRVDITRYNVEGYAPNDSPDFYTEFPYMKICESTALVTGTSGPSMNFRISAVNDQGRGEAALITIEKLNVAEIQPKSYMGLGLINLSLGTGSCVIPTMGNSPAVALSGLSARAFSVDSIEKKGVTVPETKTIQGRDFTTIGLELEWTSPYNTDISNYVLIGKYADDTTIEHHLVVSPDSKSSVDLAITVLGEELFKSVAIKSVYSGGDTAVTEFIPITNLSDLGTSGNQVSLAPPAKPSNLTFVASNANTVKLSWNNPNDDSITGYKILCRTPATESSLKTCIENTGTVSNSYTVDDLKSNTVYVFRVIALNESGESPRSNFVKLLTIGEPVPSNPVKSSTITSEPPSKPQNLEASANNDTVELSWTDPQDSTIDGYNILCKERGTKDLAVCNIYTLSNDSPRDSFTIESLDDGKYVYRVVAFNEAGDSKRSNYVRVNIGQ